MAESGPFSGDTCTHRWHDSRDPGPCPGCGYPSRQHSLPPHTHERLYLEGGDTTWHLPGADDQPCEGAEFHSPRPLFTEATWLVRREWWPEDSEHAYWIAAPDAWLCGTCRDNLAILLQMLYAADGDLDWAIRREFGNKIRALAKTGWDWFTEHRPPPTSTT